MPGTREAQAAAGGGHYVILSQSGNNKHLKQTITKMVQLYLPKQLTSRLS